MTFRGTHVDEHLEKSGLQEMSAERIERIFRMSAESGERRKREERKESAKDAFILNIIRACSFLSLFEHVRKTMQLVKLQQND